MSSTNSFANELRERLSGRLVLPGDPDYDVVRRIYNGMIDRRPAVVAQCREVADVTACVNAARNSGLPLAVRGGGHNGAGLSTCDDCLVIDLALMKSIRVSPQTHTVKVEAGCTQGEIDRATHPFGLAVPAGVVSTTGISGLTLGGGHGYLSRKYGLTIDNLLEAEIVLPDGSFVKASDSSNPDLFWAIRGGGGNFGVVTAFTFRAHPVANVQGGPMFWPLDRGEEIMRWYREFAPAAPEDLYGFFAFLHVPPEPPFPETIHMQKVAAIFWCSLGDKERTDELLRPARELEPLLDGVTETPFPVLQSMFDPLIPPGLQWYWKGGFFRELPDEAVEAHLRFASEIPTPLSQMHLYQIDGAVHRVPSAATAFNRRDANWSMVITAISDNPADVDVQRAWARSYWEALFPYSQGAGYINFMMNEGLDRVRHTYGDNYERLAQIKKRYDPQNLLRLNQNIPPAR